MLLSLDLTLSSLWIGELEDEKDMILCIWCSSWSSLCTMLSAFSSSSLIYWSRAHLLASNVDSSVILKDSLLFIILIKLLLRSSLIEMKDWAMFRISSEGAAGLPEHILSWFRLRGWSMNHSRVGYCNGIGGEWTLSVKLETSSHGSFPNV